MFRFLDHVVDFLRQNPSLVIGWLVTIITTAILHPVVAERIRRVAKNRDDHLLELKSALLVPIKADLESKILPIVTRQHGNVGLLSRIEHLTSAGMTDRSTKWKEVFGFQQADEPPISAFNQMEWTPKMPPPWRGALYDDAYDHHFRAFLILWNELTKDFEEYNESCIRYANHLRTEILRLCPLPDFDMAENQSRQPRFILANRVALFVFYRQLGLRTHETARVPEGNGERLTYLGAQTLAQGSPDEIGQCISMVDGLITERGSVECLQKQAFRVFARTLRVRRDVDHLLSIRRLRGNCPYLA